MVIVGQWHCHCGQYACYITVSVGPLLLHAGIATFRLVNRCVQRLFASCNTPLVWQCCIQQFAVPSLPPAGTLTSKPHKTVVPPGLRRYQPCRPPSSGWGLAKQRWTGEWVDATQQSGLSSVACRQPLPRGPQDLKGPQDLETT
jgi:hypothetical protein